MDYEYVIDKILNESSIIDNNIIRNGNIYNKMNLLLKNDLVIIAGGFPAFLKKEKISFKDVDYFIPEKYLSKWNSNIRFKTNIINNFNYCNSYDYNIFNLVKGIHSLHREEILKVKRYPITCTPLFPKKMESFSDGYNILNVLNSIEYENPPSINQFIFIKSDYIDKIVKIFKETKYDYIKDFCKILYGYYVCYHFDLCNSQHFIVYIKDNFYNITLPNRKETESFNFNKKYYLDYHIRLDYDKKNFKSTTIEYLINNSNVLKNSFSKSFIKFLKNSKWKLDAEEYMKSWKLEYKLDLSVSHFYRVMLTLIRSKKYINEIIVEHSKKYENSFKCLNLYELYKIHNPIYTELLDDFPYTPAIGPFPGGMKYQETYEENKDKMHKTFSRKYAISPRTKYIKDKLKIIPNYKV